MKVLVTGGAGFIGSHLTERLVRAGHQVRVLDDLSTGSRGNLRAVLDDVELVQGDIRDSEAVALSVRATEVVFHEAARCSVARSIEDPLTSNNVNVDGTLNILVAARDAGTRRVVFASSSSVYGLASKSPQSEGQLSVPLSPYAVTKLIGEHYLRVFHHLYRLETMALRYFNVFGPRQSPASKYAAVIPRFTRALLDLQPPLIYGDGEQSRDFTYVDNVVDANLLAMATGKGIGETFNVACGEGVTINALVNRLIEITGAKCEPVYTNARLGDLRHSLADLAKSREKLGYSPKVSFADGVKHTVEWIKYGSRAESTASRSH